MQFPVLQGDLMASQGGTLVKHYREMAFMFSGHHECETILNNMEICKNEIVAYRPDAVILIDYPGFNLKIAQFVKTRLNIPVFYYISPKVWAWKEYRVKSFRKYVDEMLCILPFEVEFFKKHDYRVHYVGNPSVDAIEQRECKDEIAGFIAANALPDRHHRLLAEAETGDLHNLPCWRLSEGSATTSLTLPVLRH